MLTPTRREVATTPAAKVPPGAALWGGYYDGATIRRVHLVRGNVTLLLDDGRELRRPQASEVSWLHPASGRRS